MSKKKTNKKSNRTEKITIAVLATLLIGGGCYLGGKYYMDHIKNPGVIEKIPDDNEVAVNNQGITLKMLNSVTNPDGSITRTFSYSVEPTNATNPNCEITLAYADGSDCSKIVTAFIDSVKKVISVTNSVPFDKQIILTIYSVDNPSIKSTVTIDYEKKIIGSSFKDLTISNNWKDFSFDLKDALEVQYSIYSLDKEYSFNLLTEKKSIFAFTVTDDSLKSKYSELLDFIDHYTDYLKDPIAITSEAISNKTFSPDMWVNIGSELNRENEWRSLLADTVKNKAKISFDTALKFDAGDEIIVGGNCNVSFDLSAMGYTVDDFYKSMKSIEAETPSLVF